MLQKSNAPMLTPMGATKEGEYRRTIDMMEHMTHCSKADLMFALYFLADSGYGNEDLRAMARLIEEDGKMRGTYDGEDD